MNELIFFLQILLIGIFALGALKLGESALISWVTIQSLIANLFVLKQIRLFGFEVTASDVFAIGSLLGTNFLQEYYGRALAKKAIWVCFFFLLFFSLAAQLHLLLRPSLYDASQTAFELLLSPSPRLFLASITTFFLVQQLDLLFFAFLQKSLPTATFMVRIFISLIVSQCMDTLLFTILGLYGVVAVLFDVFLFSFIIKGIAVLSLTPFTLLAKQHDKRFSF